jgi:hypothetical protein
MAMSYLRHLICGFSRYFFVKAPSRHETKVEVASATDRLQAAVLRLDTELDRFDLAIRGAEGAKKR